MLARFPDTRNVRTINRLLTVGLLISGLSIVGIPEPALAVGELTYDGCLASGPMAGCTDLPGSPLDGARGVAV